MWFFQLVYMDHGGRIHLLPTMTHQLQGITLALELTIGAPYTDHIH